MASTELGRGLRFSLRGLLVVIVFFAVACAALKFANNTWWIGVSSAALVWLLGVVIVALVDRGARQAFAIGFLATVVMYGAILFGSTKTEMYTSYTYLRLPTTQQLAWLYSVVEESRYVDPLTGKDVDLKKFFSGPGDSIPHGRGKVRTSRPGLSLAQSPEKGVFMSIGHVLWAIMLGFIGGTFARYVYARRRRTDEGNN